MVFRSHSLLLYFRTYHTNSLTIKITLIIILLLNNLSFLGLPFEDENVAKLLEKIVSVEYTMPKEFSKNLKGIAI